MILRITRQQARRATRAGSSPVGVIAAHGGDRVPAAGTSPLRRSAEASRGGAISNTPSTGSDHACAPARVSTISRSPLREMLCRRNRRRARGEGEIGRIDRVEAAADRDGGFLPLDVSKRPYQPATGAAPRTPRKAGCGAHLDDVAGGTLAVSGSRRICAAQEIERERPNRNRARRPAARAGSPAKRKR